MDTMKRKSEKHLFQVARKRNPKKIAGRLSKNKSKYQSNKKIKTKFFFKKSNLLDKWIVRVFNNREKKKVMVNIRNAQEAWEEMDQESLPSLFDEPICTSLTKCFPVWFTQNTVYDHRSVSELPAFDELERILISSHPKLFLSNPPFLQQNFIYTQVTLRPYEWMGSLL